MGEMMAVKDRPRVIFMGLRNSLALPVLEQLIQAGLPISCVVVPAPVPDSPVTPLTPAPSPSVLPLVTRFVEPDMVHLAWEYAIPVLEVGRLTDPTVLDTLAAYQPDMICVACFNQRFPAALLEMPTRGCLNWHPSLLPAYRGPAPLFWVFRHGVHETGVTIHLMDEGLDSGPIVRQERVPVPEGIYGQRLEQQCAVLGGRLMVEAVQEIWHGTARPTPQPATGGSYFPWPTVADFEILTTRPARWAFNFIRGVRHWDYPLEMEVAGRRFRVVDALGYSPGSLAGRPLRRAGAELWVQCTPGILHVQIHFE